MKLNSFYADGFRKLNGVEMALHPSMNIITGSNAQGKTSILEGIWLCSGCRSFRQSKDKDFVGFERDSAALAAIFQNSEREQRVDIALGKDSNSQRRISLNGVPLPLLSKLFGNLKCIIFTPDDLNIAGGAPEWRRNFLDISLSQIKPSYISALTRYYTALKQRNAAIKRLAAELQSGVIGNKDYVTVWSDQMSLPGAFISVLRHIYCQKLSKKAGELYSIITGGKERLQIAYSSTVFLEGYGDLDYKLALNAEYHFRLRVKLENDLRFGATSIGIQRDDMDIWVDGLNIREFGSQGQKRSAAVCIKLAAAEILAEETGEAPVVLLDDVLSELDRDRQRFLTSRLSGMQTIITACDLAAIEAAGRPEGSYFTVEDGRVSRR